MSSIDDIIRAMGKSPNNIRFADACKVCEYYFGKGRKSGSHIVYTMPRAGDPRINLQDDNDKAKAYQVKQVLRAIEKLGVQDDDSED